MKKWTALYLPNSKENKTKQFDSKQECYDYVLSQLCPACKADGLDSGCATEFLIIETKKLAEAKNVKDILRITGWKKVYDKNRHRE